MLPEAWRSVEKLGTMEEAAVLNIKQIVEGNVYRDTTHRKQRVMKIAGDHVLLMDIATLHQHREPLDLFAASQEALVPTPAVTNPLLAGQDSAGLRLVARLA